MRLPTHLASGPLRCAPRTALILPASWMAIVAVFPIDGHRMKAGALQLAVTTSGVIVAPSRRMPSYGVLTAPRRDKGFGLIEAVVSVGVLATIATGLAQLIVMSDASVRAAADDTSALLLAIQKMEQLRGLAWTYDSSRGRLSDVTTNASARSEESDGRGLTQSPPDSLTPMCWGTWTSSIAAAAGSVRDRHRHQARRSFGGGRSGQPIRWESTRWS